MRTRDCFLWLVVLLPLAVSAAVADDDRLDWSIVKPRPKGHAVFLSDSAYATLSALPVDSLSDRQFDMLMRERQFALSAAPEERIGWSLVKQPRRRQGAFLSDSLYDALSALPVDSLSEREYDLLMLERQFRGAKPREPSAAGGFLAMGLVGGFVLGLVAVGYAFAHSFGHLAAW